MSRRRGLIGSARAYLYEENAEFYKRKTGGTQSVGSGIAAIKEVRGKSIVWNQLHRMTNYSKTAQTNVIVHEDYYDVEQIEADSSRWSFYTKYEASMISTHKFYVGINVKAIDNDFTFIYAIFSSGSGKQLNAKTTEWAHVGIIGVGNNVQKYNMLGQPTAGVHYHIKESLIDLTLMFGAGNEPATVAEFEKMFPLDYYGYNKGEVIPFAGQNLATTGKNQYNPTSGKANLLGGQTYQLLGTYTNATIDGVAVTLDSNNCFTTTKDCVLDVTGGNDTDTIVALYNGSVTTYAPYESHTLPLDPSQWRDTNNNLVFPYGGMHGHGTAYDYAKVDDDGYIRRAVRVYERRAYESGDVTGGNIMTDGKTYTLYPLATPIEVELATPIYAKYLEDKDGTEEITPVNSSTPYTTMANLSILYPLK